MKRRALGIEWRDRTLTVVIVEGAKEALDVVRTSIIAWPPEQPLSAEMVRAFCEAEDLPAGTGTLVVSGSAAAAKPLILPPVALEEQRRILRENGERYFLFPTAERVYDLFDADEAQSGDDEAQTHVRWAVAAAADEIAALLDGLGAAGVFVRTVTAAERVYPAAAQWLAGASDPVPEHLVRVAGDHIDRVRYWPGGVAETESFGLDGAGLPDAGPALVMADDEAEITGGRVRVPPRGAVERPGTFAGALGAALTQHEGVAAPDLIPEPVRAARERLNRVRTLALSATAAMLLLLAGYLGAGERAQREARLQAELERTRTEATAVLALKDELEAIRGRLSTFQEARARQNHYGPVLIQLTEALPPDAWIVSFVSSEPDQAVVSGYARSATDALTALTRAPLLDDVRFDRPTRSVELGDEAFEAFTMALVFASDSPGEAGTQR